MSAVSVTRHNKRTDITEEGTREILGRTLKYTTEDLPLAMFCVLESDLQVQ
jgi:hypothetical protein